MHNSFEHCTNDSSIHHDWGDKIVGDNFQEINECPGGEKICSTLEAKGVTLPFTQKCQSPKYLFGNILDSIVEATIVETTYSASRTNLDDD